jgi:hypothetical protein
LEFLATAISQEEEVKGIQIGKEDVKLSLFADEVIIYPRDPKILPKKLEIINTLGKVAGYKINIQKSVTFLHTTTNRVRKKSGKQSYL